MDSVLTSMVEDEVDVISELKKKLKSCINRDHIFFLRDIEQAFYTLINSIPKNEKEEVIVSALAPCYIYNILIQFGYKPVVLDVIVEKGLFSLDELEKKITDNTAFVINNSVYGVLAPTVDIMELGIQVIEFIGSGFGVTDIGDLYGSSADFSIISLEENDIISALGGAVVAINSKNASERFENIINNKSHLILSRLNTSFALTQVIDIETLLDKRKQLVALYKDSLLKSGYHSLENSELNCYNTFPVVIKRGLKDIQKYCRKQGVETIKAFDDSIIQNVEGINCKVAKSLSNKTLLFPIYPGMSKDSITLILKLLSTLP